MVWSYRNPNLFPLIFPRGLVQAAASPDEEILLYHATSHSDALGKISSFRHYRWCVAQEPIHDYRLAALVRDFKFRASIKPAPAYMTGHSHLVYLKAQPDEFQALINLNPDLADLIRAECQ